MILSKVKSSIKKENKKLKAHLHHQKLLLEMNTYIVIKNNRLKMKLFKRHQVEFNKEYQDHKLFH
jgi:hypothetical protein